jgi:hypothetical protein
MQLGYGVDIERPDNELMLTFCVDGDWFLGYGLRRVIFYLNHCQIFVVLQMDTRHANIDLGYWVHTEQSQQLTVNLRFKLELNTEIFHVFKS